jgi:hypothetical protein
VALAGKEFIVEPEYTPADNPAAGGKSATAILGAGDAYDSAASRTDSSLPSAIVAARARYPDQNFKAGHLLNEIFGGDGKNPANLTILSAVGNANHKAFDDPLKTAVEQLNKAYVSLAKLGANIKEMKYGIKVEIKINGTPWGPAYPENCIWTGLVCSAAVSGEPALDGLRADEAELKNLAVLMGNVRAYVATAGAAGADIKNPRPG